MRKKKLGRPKSAPANAVKTMMTLTEDQILWMDRSILEARVATGNNINRGMILRGFLEWARTNHMDLRHLKSEADMEGTINSMFKRKES